ncbi:MAG: hypothetical protein ACAH11_02250 [Sphingomonas sp.]
MPGKPPPWYWVVSVVLLLWGLMGALSVYLHVAFGPTLDPSCTEYDKAYYAALPGWFAWDFALAVGAGLIGSAALLKRSKKARPLFVVSLIAVVIEFGWMFGFTDIIAHKGWGTTAFPAFIAAVAVFQIWFAGLAAKRGWIA